LIVSSHDISSDRAVTTPCNTLSHSCRLLDHMSLPQVLLAFISHPFIRQSSLLAVLLLIPFLVLVITSNHRSEIFWSLAMVFENLGLGFRWWSGVHPQGQESGERKKGRKKHTHHRHSRARTEGAVNGSAKHGTWC
jgi:hypothetical protein